ncbi:peptidylprolyl isomerase [Limnohabitans sp.]|uniref:peptidylprolyl isomerase n=1 Tax=Limnohabitans sp. TaxID=1907725 RepID=UPI0031FC4377
MNVNTLIKRAGSNVVAVTILMSSQVFAQVLVSGQGVSIDTKEIQMELERVPPDARSQLSSPAAMQNNVANIYARRVLAQDAIKEGLDKNFLVMAAIEKAKERILSDAMLEKIDQKNQPSLQDLEAWAQSNYKANAKKYELPEQVRASHILIRTAEPDAKAKAEGILKELRSGADFAQVAKAKSQDPGSAAKGGDLGFFVRGRMIKPFEDTAFSMAKAGDISEVIESPFGFHIIRLDEKKPAGLQPFAEVKDTLMRQAQNEILNKGRFDEKDRILKGATFNAPAIEALAKAQAPAAK